MNLLSRFGGRVWDPWREIGQLQNEMGRMLAGARAYGGVGPREYPPVNLYVNDEDLLLTMEPAGIDPAKVDVTVTGDAVEIRGERPAEPFNSGETFHRREHPPGALRRKMQLPVRSEAPQNETNYEKREL